MISTVGMMLPMGSVSSKVAMKANPGANLRPSLPAKCTSSTAQNDDPLRTKSSASLKRFSSRSPSENRSAASEKIGVKASITCVRYSSSHFRSSSVSSLPGISRSLRPLAIILCHRHSWLTAFGTSGNGSPARRFSTSLARKSANGPMSSPTLAFSSEAM